MDQTHQSTWSGWTQAVRLFTGGGCKQTCMLHRGLSVRPAVHACLPSGRSRKHKRVDYSPRGLLVCSRPMKSQPSCWPFAGTHLCPYPFFHFTPRVHTLQQVTATTSASFRLPRSLAWRKKMNLEKIEKSRGYFFIIPCFAAILKWWKPLVWFRKKLQTLPGLVTSESERALVGVGSRQGAGQTQGIVESRVCAGISRDRSKSDSLLGEVEVRKVRLLFCCSLLAAVVSCRSFVLSPSPLAWGSTNV